MHAASPTPAPLAGPGAAAFVDLTASTAFELHSDALYRFMRRMAGSQAAPDWLEAATLDVWRVLAAPGGPPLHRTRLYAVACEALAHRLPTQPPSQPGRAPPASIEAEAALSAWMHLRPGPSQPASDPGRDLALWQALGNELVTALGDLPFGPRAAVLLHQDVGLLHSEIGHVLDEPPDVARRWVWMGLLHLRCCGGALLLRRAPHG